MEFKQMAVILLITFMPFISLFVGVKIGLSDDNSKIAGMAMTVAIVLAIVMTLLVSAMMANLPGGI